MGAGTAAAAAGMLAFYEFSSIERADRGFERMAEGEVGPGLLLVGLAVGENLPGGQGGRVIFSGGKVTNSVAKALGIGRRKLGNAIERIKKAAGLRGAQNVNIDEFGNVLEKRSGELIGNVFDELPGKK